MYNNLVNVLHSRYFDRFLHPFDQCLCTMDVLIWAWGLKVFFHVFKSPGFSPSVTITKTGAGLHFHMSRLCHLTDRCSAQTLISLSAPNRWSNPTLAEPTLAIVKVLVEDLGFSELIVWVF